jgi:hypothetical protein
MSSMGTPMGNPAISAAAGAGRAVSQRNIGGSAAHVGEMIRSKPLRRAVAAAYDTARRPGGTVRTGSRSRRAR